MHPFVEALDSKWGNYIANWWKLKEEYLKNWVHPLRQKHILLGLVRGFPYEIPFVFNGAGFRNELNTPWKEAGELRDVILFAPVLRREILPWELVLDPDSENEKELVKKGRWIQASLEALEIEYTMGYTGRRSFHFHIIADPDTKLPEELPEGFNLRLFKEALFNIIGYCAGFDGLDVDTTGFKAKRHAIREFFSIHEKGRCFKIPLEEVEIRKVKLGVYPEWLEDWEGYNLWKPSKSQVMEILEEVERIIAQRKLQEKSFERFWRSKPRKERTIGSRWRLERIKKYAEILRRYGKLIDDPKLMERHGNEWNARAHLIILMIKEDFTDEEIHEIFSRSENYDPKRTQYFIDWFRRKEIEVSRGVRG